MKALSQIDTDDITYEELTERFEAVKTSSVDSEWADLRQCCDQCFNWRGKPFPRFFQGGGVPHFWETWTENSDFLMKTLNLSVTISCYHLCKRIVTRKKLWKNCHQRPDFMAKLHQIQFWLGLCPNPGWGSSRHSQGPPSWLKRGTNCPQTPPPSTPTASRSIIRVPPLFSHNLSTGCG